MNGNVDPRIDKMMAYLYGELPEAEERAASFTVQTFLLLAV